MNLFKFGIAFGLVVNSLSSWAYHTGDVVRLEVSDGCSSCARAEHLLDNHHIHYSTEQAGYGFVPKLYVNGKYIGVGYDVVETYVNS